MNKRKRDERDLLYEFHHTSYSNMFHIFEHEMTKEQRKQACTKLYHWHGDAIMELVKKREFDTSPICMINGTGILRCLE